MKNNFFKNVSVLIKHRRNHSHSYMSQAVLARLLGFENAQCISNVERGSSRIPFRKIERLVAVLNINPEELKAAMMKDFELELDYYLHLSNNQNEEAFSSSCDIQIQAH